MAGLKRTDVRRNSLAGNCLLLISLHESHGLLLIAMTLGYSISLAFPLAAGFALIGPLAAIGLYELSRRKEAGLDCSAGHVLDVLHSPLLAAIVLLGCLLMTIFLIWLAVAEAIYVTNFGYGAPTSVPQFVDELFNTSPGWNLIIVGTGVGFLFAVLTFTISAVSFPLLLDRDVGAAVALLTSIRVVAANPVTMALWGLIITALLVIRSVAFFLGLAVVVPVLGHATWHLYRKAVEPDPDPHPDCQPREKSYRSAADFPTALFPARR